jgi:hypothetical protein
MPFDRKQLDLMVHLHYGLLSSDLSLQTDGGLEPLSGVPEGSAWQFGSYQQQEPKRQKVQAWQNS